MKDQRRGDKQNQQEGRIEKHNQGGDQKALSSGETLVGGAEMHTEWGVIIATI